MKYNLFLFDLDDTLLDFGASEKLAFARTINTLGYNENLDNLFAQYQAGNLALWKLFEAGKTTKNHLKIERFRSLFEQNSLDFDVKIASELYLDTLPETVVLIDYAVELCEWLSTKGEIGIITNGIETVQMRRIANSPLKQYISFVSVSETYGFAKPDVRFFEHTVQMAKHFDRATTLMVGDRHEADVQGAQNFGVDCCWYNPHGIARPAHLSPKYEITHLSQMRDSLEKTG